MQKDNDKRQARRKLWISESLKFIAMLAALILVYSLLPVD